ncbi:MAG: ABC transporter permease [Bacteroidetes bacterium]|nr:ABC transporter permease [Bacteroidota bacterium]
MQLLEIKKKAFGFAEKQGLLIAFLLLVIFFSIASDVFLTYSNIVLVLRQVSILGIIACGMTFVIIGGNFDLSVGSLTSLTTVVVVSLHDKIGPIPAILVALVVGLASGTLAGYLVGYLKLNSMIITLGLLGVLQAITLIYTGGKYSRITDPEGTWFGFIGRGFILGMPFPVIILAVLILIFAIILMKTVFGRQLLAVGGNPVASKFSGIRETRIIMLTFMASGLVTGIGGVLLGSRIMAAQNYIGEGYEFQVITGVILGGTSLLGGEGNIFKSFLGILIVGMLMNGFILLGFPYYSQWVAQWVILVGVVWIDIASKRGKVLA